MSARDVLANTTWEDGERIGFTAADLILSALTAAGYAVEQGWQPIETAPRDGTRMLCFTPAAEGRAAVVRNDYWWVQERGFAQIHFGQPYTHWRPLPAPPAGEARNDGRRHGGGDGAGDTARTVSVGNVDSAGAAFAPRGVGDDASLPLPLHRGVAP